jgi:hypothetical protein
VGQPVEAAAGAGETTEAVGEEAAAIVADVTLTHSVPHRHAGRTVSGRRADAARYAIRSLSGCRKDVIRTLSGRVVGSNCTQRVRRAPISRTA